MITLTDIAARCEALAAGGLHPQIIMLEWWSDTGWQLVIELADWISFGTPASEIPNDWEWDLPAPYHAPCLPKAGPLKGAPGVTFMGGMRYPAYKEPFPAAESWYEQAEATIKDCDRQYDGDSPDGGHLDLLDTPYKARHRWHRCQVWHWRAPADQALHQKFREREVERWLDNQPQPERPVVIRGRKMLVYRPCGHITTHHQAPGRGRFDSDAKRRFGVWLAQQPCLACL